jgi:UPF0755 protein
MRPFFRIFLLSLVLIGLLGAVLVGGAWYWAIRPLDLSSDKLDFVIEPGSSPRTVVRAAQAAGIQVWEPGFVWMARLSELDKQIKAGGYEVNRGDSAWRLLQRLARGDMSQRQVTFVEGWRYSQIRQALATHPDVRQTLSGLEDIEVAKLLGVEGDSLEGLLFPDTYVFTPGTIDLELMRRALHEGHQVLMNIWAARDPGSPLKTPYEALILGSIIEKETGHSQDRERVGGVFINRLRIGMPLQTDPTVIYGMGERYEGRIRKRDLLTDTPWNTYTRNGLPSTPIASPGRLALRAAVQPEAHTFFYFVARGDGTSVFSTSLSDHNRNVARYILGGRS